MVLVRLERVLKFGENVVNFLGSRAWCNLPSTFPKSQPAIFPRRVFLPTHEIRQCTCMWSILSCFCQPLNLQFACKQIENIPCFNLEFYNNNLWRIQLYVHVAMTRIRGSTGEMGMTKLWCHPMVTQSYASQLGRFPHIQITFFKDMQDINCEISL